MRFLRLWCIALVVCGLGWRAADAVPQSAAVTAALTIMGASEEAAAMMNHCRMIDSANADVYDDLALHVRNLYLPYIQRADEILPTEGTRSGHDEQFYHAMLPNVRIRAQNEIKELVAALKPEQAMAACRLQPANFQKQRGFFVPPPTRFPKEVRVLEDWR
jgi:hypothetical protein